MKHDNVIPFRQPNKPSSEGAAKQAKRIDTKAKSVIKIFAYKTVVGLLVAIRYALFFLMLWIRTPIRFIFRIIAVPTLFIAPIIYFGLSGHPQKATMLTWLISVGFGAFVLLWFYDSVLLWLSPEDIVLNLN